ncbi:MAG: GGDEF domain-containing protein [bacterium]|nr:GGDEF domain-containing protein [bacterium]
MTEHEEIEKKVELLRNVDVFSRLREYELDVIARYSSYLGVKRGDAVFSPGDRARGLFVVEKGRIGIVGIRDDEHVELARIIAGESFGELDFLGDSLRTAGAFAEENSLLLVFPGNDITARDIIENHPQIGVLWLHRLMAIITDRAIQVNSMLEEKTEWVDKLRRRLHTDKLTGLFNQIYLQEEMSPSLTLNEQETALIMIKPDSFKAINDTYGHEAGDQILKLMGIFLQASLEEDDVAIRYHGDEFAALIRGAGRDRALKTAEEIRENFYDIDIKGILGADDIILELSIGIALYPEESPNGTSLIGTAYQKMYEARDSGGNRILI